MKPKSKALRADPEPSAPWRAVRSAAAGLSTWLVGLPRYHKRFILVAVDFACLAFALWVAMSLRFGQPYLPPDPTRGLIFVAAPLITVATFAWYGLYRIVTRYIGHHGTTAIAVCMALSVLIWALVVLMTRVEDIPRIVILGYAVFGAGMIYANRQLATLLLRGRGFRFRRDQMRNVPRS